MNEIKGEINLVLIVDTITKPDEGCLSYHDLAHKVLVRARNSMGTACLDVLVNKEDNPQVGDALSVTAKLRRGAISDEND